MNSSIHRSVVFVLILLCNGASALSIGEAPEVIENKDGTTPASHGTPARPDAPTPEVLASAAKLERIEKEIQSQLLKEINAKIEKKTVGVIERARHLGLIVNIDISKPPNQQIALMEEKLHITPDEGAGLMPRLKAIEQAYRTDQLAELFASEYGNSARMTVKERVLKAEAFFDKRRDNAEVVPVGDQDRMTRIQKKLPKVAGELGRIVKVLPVFEKEFGLSAEKDGKALSYSERLTQLEALVQKRLVDERNKAREALSETERLEELFKTLSQK